MLFRARQRGHKIQTMQNLLLLSFYCFLVFIVSILGGLYGIKINPQHRTLQLALSFVSGLVLGVAFLHLLPEALHYLDHEEDVGLWLLIGLLCMFFLERMFSFHQHESKQSDLDSSKNTAWKGAAFGLSVHSLLAGLALGAATANGQVGVSVMLAIVLHKPFDAFAIVTLMRTETSTALKNLVNVLFALLVPMGAFAFSLGIDHPHGQLLGAVMAFSAGIFVYISLSDLLPELQFHDHDRLPMSLMLLAGVGITWIATLAEH